MPKVFISYRRDDNPDAAGRIYDRLAEHFGRDAVYFDIDSVPAGVDFRQNIHNAVADCDVMLVIIGDKWLERDQTGRSRLDDQTDFVRIEIETALSLEIPLIPVPVGSAEMPRETDLPNAIGQLAFRNAREVRTGPEFQGYLRRLIRGIEALGERTGPAEADSTTQQPDHAAERASGVGSSTKRYASRAAALIAIAVAASYWIYQLAFPETYSLTVHVTPSDAVVVVASSVYTPAMQLEPGDYPIHVAKVGFADWQQTVTIDRDTSVEVALEPAGQDVPDVSPSTATAPVDQARLQVVTDPPAARVTIRKDDASQLLTYEPGMMLDHGSYEIDVSANGYRSRQLTTSINGGTLLVAVSLDSETGVGTSTSLRIDGTLNAADIAFNEQAEPRVAVSFTGTGEQLFTGTGYQLQYWDGRTRELLDAVFLTETAGSVGLDSAADQIAYAGYTAPTMHLWQPQTGSQRQVAADEELDAFHFSTNGEKVVTVASRWIRVLDVATGRAEHSFDCSGLTTGAALSPDNTTIAVRCHADIRIYELATGNPILAFDAPGAFHSPGSLAFRPDGKMLVVGDGAGRLYSWHLDSGESGEMLGERVGGMGPGPFATMFDPSSKVVFTAYGTGWINAWSVQTGALLGHLIGHSEQVIAIAISPDSRSLITASADGSVRTWNVAGLFDQRDPQ